MSLDDDKGKWEKVVELNDEAIREILREDGIPEEELEEELLKMKTNQVVQSRTRSVIITPEIDRMLYRLFKSGHPNFTTTEWLEMKEALWPPK